MNASGKAPEALEPLGAREHDPLALLHFAFRAVVAEPDARLARLGLGRVHHRILFFIARSPGLRVMDLSATLGVTKQALHHPLRELLRQKLVHSRAEPGNLRERRLTLTAAGRALEQRLSGHQRRAFAAAFRSAGARAARGWREVMRELVSRCGPAAPR
jgi:DNA-binding MarR family transcriptional regulator